MVVSSSSTSESPAVAGHAYDRDAQEDETRDLGHWSWAVKNVGRLAMRLREYTDPPEVGIPIPTVALRGDAGYFGTREPDVGYLLYFPSTRLLAG